MDYFFLSNVDFFNGITEAEINAMLGCMGVFYKKYKKDEVICRAGEIVETIGLVISGSVFIELPDIWGNNSIINHIESGQIFTETYACIPDEPLMVNVTACSNCEILFFNTKQLFTTCKKTCSYHNRVIHNLAQTFAQKNLSLTRRILHTSSKTIRGRLLSYFNEQVKRHKSYQFSIPFNRQQLADYLSVDRSALSAELSKMQDEGFITFDKNKFSLKRVVHT